MTKAISVIIFIFWAAIAMPIIVTEAGKVTAILIVTFAGATWLLYFLQMSQMKEHHKRVLELEQRLDKLVLHLVEKGDV